VGRATYSGEKRTWYGWSRKRDVSGSAIVALSSSEATLTVVVSPRPDGSTALSRTSVPDL
jgi:hypothetical protein